jgi:hypothetical protein
MTTDFTLTFSRKTERFDDQPDKLFIRLTGRAGN